LNEDLRKRRSGTEGTEVKWRPKGEATSSHLAPTPREPIVGNCTARGPPARVEDAACVLQYLRGALLMATVATMRISWMLPPPRNKEASGGRGLLDGGAKPRGGKGRSPRPEGPHRTRSACPVSAHCALQHSRRECWNNICRMLLSPPTVATQILERNLTPQWGQNSRSRIDCPPPPLRGGGWCRPGHHDTPPGRGRIPGPCGQPSWSKAKTPPAGG